MTSFSFIVPVYNRPGELGELLNSLSVQTDKDFEVIIVEDGSNNTAKKVIKKYSTTLKINK